MKNEGKKRLLKLAEVLETNSQGRVLTVPGDGKVDFDLGIIADYRRDTGCGTAACAMGYAGLHPWFRARGLRTEGDDREMPDVVFKKTSGYISPAMQFFGITYDSAVNLFDPTCYDSLPTPKQVAKRIRAFIRERVG